MAKTWFPHEDPLDEGEESKPILGPRFSLFWFFGVLVGIGLVLIFLYIAFQFIFSPVQR